MKSIAFGTRGLQVSRLCFGTLPLGPLQHDLPPERGAELILHAARQGVTMVDTAEYYDTYPHIALALREAPGLAVCTKSYAYDEAGAQRAFQAAQTALGRTYIDVFLLHEQESEHTLRGHAQALRFYQRMQRAGEIGAVGLSTHHVRAVYAAADAGLDVVFAIANLRGIGIVDGTRADMERALAHAHAKGLGVMAMKALGGGHLIEDREAALSYAMELPGMDVVALGMSSEAEIDYNVALFSGFKPPEAAARRSANAPRTLHIAEWCEGCGRCVARCGQGALSLKDGRAVARQEACVRCGYCAGVCPQFCIKVF